MERRIFRNLGTLAIVAASIALLLWLRCEKQSHSAAVENPPRVWDPYRLSIKLGTDPGARSITATAEQTTLRKLLAQTNTVTSGRVSPLETTRWRVIATITAIAEEPDGDMVLQLQDEQAEASAELPDPELCSGSPFQGEIITLRQRLHKHPKLPSRAELTGIGFAGLPTPRNRTGIRLYPLLALSWISGSAK